MSGGNGGPRIRARRGRCRPRHLCGDPQGTLQTAPGPGPFPEKRSPVPAGKPDVTGSRNPPSRPQPRLFHIYTRSHLLRAGMFLPAIERVLVHKSVPMSPTAPTLLSVLNPRRGPRRRATRPSPSAATAARRQAQAQGCGRKPPEAPGPPGNSWRCCRRVTRAEAASVSGGALTSCAGPPSRHCCPRGSVPTCST